MVCVLPMCATDGRLEASTHNPCQDIALFMAYTSISPGAVNFEVPYLNGPEGFCDVKLVHLPPQPTQPMDFQGTWSKLPFCVACSSEWKRK